MIDLFAVAKQLQDFCDAHAWRCCFIGGIAVQRWGEPRVTRDCDLTLMTGFGGEEPFIDALLAAYPARIPSAKEFAQTRRVLLLKSPAGIGIDISLGALPFEDQVVERSSLFSFGEFELRTCSAEDLIVLKLFASRPLDIQDAEGVALRNTVDWAYVQRELAPLAEAKEDPTISVTLQRIRELSGS